MHDSIVFPPAIVSVHTCHCCRVSVVRFGVMATVFTRRFQAAQIAPLFFCYLLLDVIVDFYLNRSINEAFEYKMKAETTKSFRETIGIV